MVVCVCNAVREQDLRGAVRAGSSHPKCAYRRLGCTVQCGQCLPFAREIIQDERQAA